MKKLLSLLGISCILMSCSHHKAEHVERAFYFWKNQSYQFTPEEDTLVKKLDVNKLYVKFFEVEYSPTMGNIPTAKTALRFYRQDDKTEIIPTVYLRNEVFLKATHGGIDTLADNVNFLIRKYCGEGREYAYKMPFSEFQMDCDWTIKSKDNYFYFLKRLKEISKLKISCTLRLYPYKYPEKMGIPPVDKVTLMCYNLMNPLESPTKNSILDTDELSSYLNVERKYPLHMDIALPVYSWLQVYQNNHFVKVLQRNGDAMKPLMKQIKPLWYEIQTDTVVDEFYLRAGDKIKLEETNAAALKKAIGIIKKNVNLDKNITVTLFHLDGEQLKKYNNATLSDFYSAFTE